MTLDVADYRGDAAAWDAFVARAPGATHCHLHAWADALADGFGHRVWRIAARRGEALGGALTLVRVRSLLFGDYLVSLPFLNYGGPVGDAEAVQALAAHAVAMARELGVGLLELRSRVALPVDLALSQRKVTLTMPLAADPEAQMKAFDAKLRAQVRRPGKDGLVARSGDDQLDAFYRVFAEHMRDLGTPVLGRRVFEAVLRHLGHRAQVTAVYAGAQPVAGGIAVDFEGEVEMVWASSLRSHQRSAPNMLLYWAAMTEAMGRGCTRFNFGRCSPGSGPHRFKLQWGSVEEPLHWYQYARGGLAKTPSPDDGRYRLGPRVWRRLPLPVANLVGPSIVRLIP